MNKEKPKPLVRRPDVLKKLNAESLHLIERGLIGELPERLRPPLPVPVRGRLHRPSELALTKQTSLLSSCLPVIPDSPHSELATTSSDDEQVVTLKKSFSFRDKISRMSLFGKDKEKMEKPKCKTIAEDEQNTDKKDHSHQENKPPSPVKTEHDHKHSKRFWFFRNKEAQEKKQQRPNYVRSKSFEFLPRAAEEEELEKQSEKSKRTLKSSISFVFGSTDSLDDWTSNEDPEYPSNVYYDNDDGVFLKSIKEFPASESSTNNSSMSIVTSTSSGIVTNMFKSQSVQDILNEFNKAVDMFSENYLSDSEPYTKSGDKVLPVSEKRKSSSFSTLPSPKVMQVNKVSEVSEDFKVELSRVLSVKRKSGEVKAARRGSVTDWFVLEDQIAPAPANESNKYRRARKKPINRVRRISSTKYWITPEECAVYSREQRPPLVIPRITQYRTPRRETKPHHPSSYPEETIPEPSVKSSVRKYERLQDWSPPSERSRAELERSFSKANSDSPPLVRLNKRLGNSTENLLFQNIRRPNHLQLPASSSGDSLDVELREREPGYAKSRKSRSMVAPKHRVRSPVPAPRMLLHQPAEATVVLEGAVKRTKFSESGKKSKKHWTDCYMILTQTALVFYKDQKTYHATRMPKPPGTPPSPAAPRAELVLPLRNAHVVQCIQMHTKRFTRSMVLTVGYDQYLLQDETEDGAKRWLMCIQNIIYKLGPPMPEDFHSPQHLSSNTDLESLARTPPAARHAGRHKHRAGGSSNEDLSDSTEASIQKSHVRSILRKFFPKRPAMEVLVKKGIYKDEPVFGRRLDEVCPATSPRVPDFVVACVKEIESSEENMCTDGLYRASGNLSQVQKIRLEIDQNNISVIENNTDIHVLTGSLKLFFRELKEPLIPCTIFDRILAACSIKPREAKIKEFRDIIQALPQCNRDTLKYLLEHLLRVTQYSEQNRMHTANLAIVFGPTLLWAPAEQAHNIAIDCIQQNNVVDILLNDFKDIFVEDNPKGKKKA